LKVGISYIKNAFIPVTSISDKTKTVKPIEFLDTNIKTYIETKLKENETAIKTNTEKTADNTQKTDENVFKNVSEGTKEELKEIEKKESEQKKTDEKKNDNNSKISPIGVGVGGGVGFGLYKILNSIAESPILMLALGVGAVTLLNNNKKQKR
jgi:tRNA A37 threonylcarbamoyltransferase TsaD